MGDLPTRVDLFAVGRRSLTAANAPRVNPKVADIEGSNINIAINAAALMGEELSRAFQQCVRGQNASTARKDQLDRLIMEYTGGLLPRLDASPAHVTLTISRPGAAAGSGIVPAGTRVTTPGGVQFSTDTDLPFGGVDLSLTVAATCTVTGPVGRIPAGVLAFVDQPYDGTMVVATAIGAAGGTDEEDDVRYLARYFGFFSTVRRGILPAIQQAALAVPGVEIATASEILNTVGMPEAAVQLVVGDGDGNFSATMLQQVRDSLLTYRAGGIPVFVLGGVVAFEAVTWSGIRYKTGIDTRAAQDAIRAVTVAVSQFLSPGATLYRSMLITGASAVPGVLVPAAGLLAPAGDVVAATPQTITRVRPQDVTFA